MGGCWDNVHFRNSLSSLEGEEEMMWEIIYLLVCGFVIYFLGYKRGEDDGREQVKEAWRKEKGYSE